MSITFKDDTRCPCKIDCTSARRGSKKRLPWSCACVSRQEAKCRNIETTCELSDDEKI